MSAGIGPGSSAMQPAQPRAASPWSPNDLAEPCAYCATSGRTDPDIGCLCDAFCGSDLCGVLYPETPDAAQSGPAAPSGAPGAQDTPVAGSGGSETSTGTTGGVPGSVPKELRAIAYTAFAGRPADAEGYYSIDSERSPWTALNEALAAVLPAHEAMVRAKVAEELVAAPIHKILAEDDDGQHQDHAAWCPGCRAARIARGGQA